MTESQLPRGDGVAVVLEELRSSVRQRRAELAASGAESEEAAAQLAELRQHEFVQEPRPVSPRRGVGGLIVWLRKAVYHLFVKWFARSVLQQQNEFNQAAASILAGAVERERELRREVGRLRARLDELERREAAPAKRPEAGA